MAKKSITKRWIFNNLGVIVLALLVIEMVVIYAIQSYFYNSAKQYLVKTQCCYQCSEYSLSGQFR